MSRSIDTPPAVAAVVGYDRFMRTERVRGLAAARRGDDTMWTVTKLDGATADLASVLDDVRTESLLGDRFIVVVDDADPFITKHRKALETYAEAPCPTGCLILACNPLPKSTRLYKILSRNHGIIESDPPMDNYRNVREPWAVQWAMERARRTHGKTLTRAVAQMLARRVGRAPGVLACEVAKLATYVGDRADITPADVEALVGATSDEKVFAVVDAMSSGDTAAALQRWDQAIATDRGTLGQAVGGLRWAIDQAGRRGRVSASRAAQQLDDLLEVDLALKTGGSTPDYVRREIDKFIVQNARRGSTSRATTREHTV